MERPDERFTIFTVREVAARLHINKGTLYALIARDEFPHLRLGRKIMVSAAQLEAFLKGGAVR